MKRATKFLVIGLSGLFLFVAALVAQTIELVPVVSRPIARTVNLPGELRPYLWSRYMWTAEAP